MRKRQPGGLPGGVPLCTLAGRTCATLGRAPACTGTKGESGDGQSFDQTPNRHEAAAGEVISLIKPMHAAFLVLTVLRRETRQRGHTQSLNAGHSWPESKAHLYNIFPRRCSPRQWSFLGLKHCVVKAAGALRKCNAAVRALQLCLSALRDLPFPCWYAGDLYQDFTGPRPGSLGKAALWC